MPPAFQHFLQSETFIALFVAVLIFLMTIFLVVKQWIGFSITFLFLVFALATGVVIKNQDTFQGYLKNRNTIVDGSSSEDAFHKQMMQAVEDLKTEVNTEKENLRKVGEQVQEIFDHMDTQKLKLQNFIEETRERFKAEHHSKPIEEDSPKNT